MRRTLATGIMLVAALLATGCEQSEQPNFLGPAFGTTAENPCESILGVANSMDTVTTKYEIALELYAGINTLFNDVRSRNGAKSHLDNIVREICEGDWVGAQTFVHTFIQQVEGQPDDKLMETPSADDLIAWVQVLAYPMENNVLPEGALGVAGALALSTGGDGADPVKTRNGHVLVNASDFPPGEPFFVAIAPGPEKLEDYVVYQDTLYDGSRVTGIITESYQIATDHPGNDLNADSLDVLIVFCRSGVAPSPYPSSLKIAHQKDIEVELLTTFSVLCPPAASALLPDAPAWLGSLARLGGALGKVLAPTPLYARAETGLGGRAKSFSPFALVYPLTELIVTCESRAAGTLSVNVGDELACSDAFDGGATVDTIQVPAGTVTVTASAVDYKRRHDIWYSSGNLDLDDPVACPPKGTTPATCTFTLPAVGGSLSVKLTGY